MQPTQKTPPARKLEFLVLTFALSTAVVLAMLGVGVVAEDQPGPVATRSEPASDRAGSVGPEKDGDGVIDAAQKRDLPLEKKDPPQPQQLGLPNIADIAAKANPAVVNIQATEIIRPGSRGKSNPHAPFEFFFPRPDGEGDPEDEDDDLRQDSGGSGFIVSPDGYVMTNYHVIEGADRIEVSLPDDNTDYSAEIVGIDPTTDLALIKIQASYNLPTIPLGDSGNLRIGDWVIAIGNPLAYDNTVTVGVVSAKGRKLRGLSRDVSLDNYIQTDAAINRGNSGGPLLNLAGEAIGINSAISVAGQGISFAIPINMARDVMRQLRDKGKVSRGFLGVTIVDIRNELNPDDRSYWGLNDYSGAFIQSVTKDNPADVAGLKPGDAIVSVDDQEIASSDDLIRTISAKEPGATVSLGIIRGGKPHRLTAELIDRPNLSEQASADVPPAPLEDKKADQRLGLTVEDLSAQSRRDFQVAPNVKGVVITHVSQVSEAWERSLRDGDVIMEINRQPISSIEDYRAAVDGLKEGDLMALYVSYRGETAGRFVTLRIGAE